MFKVSEAASLALHTMVLLAEDRSSLVSSKRLADRLSVSEAHLSKVLQRLARAGLVKSTRGPGGGFAMAKSPERVSLMKVYECIDGPFNAGSCVLEGGNCSHKACIFNGVLDSLVLQVREYMSKTTLDKVVDRDRHTDGH
jgi:Rrf2 family protein